MQLADHRSSPFLVVTISSLRPFVRYVQFHSWMEQETDILPSQIIIVDYFFIKRGNIHTPSLFDPSPNSLYYYTKGWNLKAVGCWICAVAFGIPGLVGAYHPSWVSQAATEIYHTGWIICFAVAATFFYAINRLLPSQVYPESLQATVPLRFEELADAEGYLEGESVIEFVTPKGEDSIVSDKV